MVIANMKSKEIHCKILCCGTSNAGKKTFLHSIKQESEKLTNKINDINIEDKEFSKDSKFSFLPISLGIIKDFHIKVHIFTLQENIEYTSLQNVLVNGVDGLLYIADSQITRMPDNINCLNRVKKIH